MKVEGNKCDRCKGFGKESEDDLFGSRKAGDECWKCEGTGIDCRYTSDLVCPYCGHAEQDTWESPESDSKYQCGSCEKYFTFETETTRTFISSRADCLNGGEHRWGRPLDYTTYYYKSCRDCGKSERIPKAEPRTDQRTE